VSAELRAGEPQAPENVTVIQTRKTVLKFFISFSPRLSAGRTGEGFAMMAVVGVFSSPDPGRAMTSVGGTKISTMTQELMRNERPEVITTASKQASKPTSMIGGTLRPIIVREDVRRPGPVVEP
jgi:hypothetical protein